MQLSEKVKKLTPLSQQKKRSKILWEKIMDMVKKCMAWVKARVSERTSWDGAVIIAMCVMVICFGGLAKVAAFVGLGYGAWTCYKAEA